MHKTAVKKVDTLFGIVLMLFLLFLMLQCDLADKEERETVMASLSMAQPSYNDSLQAPVLLKTYAANTQDHGLHFQNPLNEWNFYQFGYSIVVQPDACNGSIWIKNCTNNPIMQIDLVNGKILYNNKEIATKEDVSNAGGSSPAQLPFSLDEIIITDDEIIITPDFKMTRTDSTKNRYWRDQKITIYGVEFTSSKLKRILNNN